MAVLRFLLLAPAAVLFRENEVVLAASAADCSIANRTLSFDCDTTCDANVPCRLNATASTCKLICMDKIYYNSKNFFLLIPFGKWKSAQELSEKTPLSASTTNDLEDYYSVSNNLLDTIDTMDLASTTTKVAILGGSGYVVNTRGHVANVKLSSSLLTKETQVTNVDLSNLNLANYSNQLPSLLPPKVQDLSLDNTLLESFPNSLGDIKTLKFLSIQSNYFTSVNTTTKIDSLSELYLTGNDIQSFTAVFPSLVNLGVGANQLKEVPPVLAQHTRLQELWLYNNSISAVTKAHEIPNIYYLKLTNNHFKNLKLTTEHFHFIANLHSFTIDPSILSKDCPASEQKGIRGVTFCVSETATADEYEDDHEDENGHNHHHVSTGAIIGITAGALVLVIVIGVMFFRNRNLKNAKDAYTLNEGTMGTMTGTNGTGTMSLWQDVDMLSVKVNAEEIDDVKVIGKGAYGDVWLVKYRKTQLLASKRLRKSEANRSRIKSFTEEIKLVAKFDHPNIVQFVGAAWTIESDLQALFEYMDGGDLRDYLENSHTPRTWSPEKVQIAIDVAEALVYVHSFAPPLVHRDLKSRNVLLSSELQAKLTDFGVSRFRSEDNTMTSGVGTGKWLAPEVISGSTDYGPAADIFSFGAVLSELDSHKLPYDELRGPNGTKLADVALLQMIATGQAKPSLSASCPPKIVELANRCFALNPNERPAAAEVAYALRVIKRSMMD